ncbi:MAG: ATP-binding protein [Gemmatimonadota bacterium]
MALAFRRRIFLWLVVVSALPASVAITVSLASPDIGKPVGGVAAWERAADSWREARRALDIRAMSPGLRAALDGHGDELGASLSRARQARAIHNAFAGTLAAVAIALAILVGGGAIRLAGHLSRQLSRPIDELIAWTGHLMRGERLPDAPPARGAPEFEVLRDAFRKMAAELDRARSREVEAAALRAFREVARQVAHELKNPLTPMRFAVSRLKERVGPEDRELIEILDGESARIEEMAREFSLLGRLPEGPPAPLDVGEMLEELSKGLAVRVRIERSAGLPLVTGHYEPLRRAFQNLILNACQACAANGEVVLTARRSANGAAPEVEVTVRDNGAGISAEHLPRIFEPYFTTKAGGTGLGLALVRQTIHDHGGAIAVASEPGRGTTFTVTLPVAPA